MRSLKNVPSKITQEWSEGIKRLIRSDPALVVKNMFKFDMIPTQAQILRDIFDNSIKDLRIISGHGTGKSTILLYTSLLWQLLHGPDTLSLILSPTHRQSLNMIGALKQALSTAFPDIPAGVNASGWIINDRLRKQILMTSTDQPERIQGLHFENLLVGVDEGTGVPDAVFSGAKSILSTPNSKLVVATNPTKKNWVFVSLDSADKVYTLSTIDIKAETDSCKAAGSLRKDFISDNFIESYKNASDDEKRIRLLGEWPSNTSNSFYFSARPRTENDSLNDVLTVGIDLAGVGRDKTILTACLDYTIVESCEIPSPKNITKHNTAIKTVIDKYKHNRYNGKENIRFNIFVDLTGQLIEYKIDFPYTPVLFSAKHDPKYANIRSEMLDMVTEASVNSTLIVDKDVDLGHVKIEADNVERLVNAEGRIQITKPSKSTDYLDSLAICWANHIHERPVDLNDRVKDVIAEHRKKVR